MKHLHLYYLVFILLGAISCSKVIENYKITDMGGDIAKSDYNRDLFNVCKSISASLKESVAARQLINVQVNKKIDGDYDVLLRSIAECPLNVSDEYADTKSGAMESFGDLLNKHMPEDYVQTKSSSDVIGLLGELYPNMQISIPVHADEWDPDTYIPIVAFIPEDYDEDTTDSVMGISSEGTTVEIDAHRVPEQPVIVVSMNERAESVGDNQSVNVPSSPQKLSGLPSFSSIDLSWERVPECDMYYIWRKTQGQNNYVHVGTLNGVNNNTYCDGSINANQYYWYYVTAVKQIIDETTSQPILIIESDPSNSVVVKAPNVPQGLMNFNVSLITNSIADYRWNNNGESQGEICIDYYVPGIINNYRSYKRLPGNTTSATGPLYYRGRRYVFKAYRASSLGQSDPGYDFCYSPYRDITSTSNVYIKKLEYSGGLEGWLQGAPEFYIKLFYYDNEKLAKESTVELKFDKAMQTQKTFSNRLAFVFPEAQLSRTTWFSSLCFYLYESDGDKHNWKINISPSIAVKKDSLDLSFSLGSVSFNLDKQDDPLGYNTLYYYQDTNTVLNFD